MLQELKEELRGRGWALLALRLVIGFGLAAHGYAKLERGVDHFAQVIAAMGLPAPSVLAWLTALIEFFGGIALMSGAFVPWIAAPAALIMLTALFGVHWPYGFSSVRLKAITAAGAQFGPVGYELNLLYLVGLLVLAVSSPPPLSVDAWLAKRRKGARP